MKRVTVSYSLIGLQSMANEQIWQILLVDTWRTEHLDARAKSAD